MKFHSLQIIVIKKKTIFLIIIGVILVMLANVCLAALSNRTKIWTVIIDPGHGGIDPGTSSQNGKIKEKDLVLDLGLKIREKLQGSKINVILTRDSDIDLSGMERSGGGRQRKDLNNRVEIAKKNKADILISLHLNWSNDYNAKGAIMFFQKHNSRSKELVSCIQKAFIESSLDIWEPPASRDLYILRTSPVPAVLIELGFVSNDEELILLQDEKYQEKLVNAICSGIKEYINTM
ncbi:MAG TPA: N-acetylmuramoyl-L-alanine amidase, partial [Clostridia bacterium]|nr:N-acetylmuramoyl-L-alanine amidase [Clostridia bacterium]